MCSACAPHVHRMCTACAPHVHRMYTACAPHVHRMCTACAAAIAGVCTALYVHCRQASSAQRAATGDDCLQLAADLAVFYSEMRAAGKVRCAMLHGTVHGTVHGIVHGIVHGARHRTLSSGQASVSVTSPKHITKPKGAPLGAVRIKQEGPSLMGVPDNVPEELKLLREQNERQAWGGD